MLNWKRTASSHIYSSNGSSFLSSIIECDYCCRNRIEAESACPSLNNTQGQISHYRYISTRVQHSTLWAWGQPLTPDVGLLKYRKLGYARVRLGNVPVYCMFSFIIFHGSPLNMRGYPLNENLMWLRYSTVPLGSIEFDHWLVVQFLDVFVFPAIASQFIFLQPKVQDTHTHSDSIHYSPLYWVEHELHCSLFG